MFDNEFSQFDRSDGYYIDRDCDYIPEVFAHWFANANSEDQQRFIEEVASISEKKYKRPPQFQWAYWTLSSSALAMLQEMFENAKRKDIG